MKEMKKILFLMVVMFLFSISFVSALNIEELQKQIADKQLNSMQNQGQPPTPMGVIKLALKNSPEFRAEFIKSILIILAVMSLTIVDVILKGFAMWKASKNNSKLWFWLLLVISSLGILPLCYLLFAKSKKEEHKKK